MTSSEANKSPAAFSRPATVNADDPWPGLLAFREADSGYFQGRKTETEELLRLVMRERLTVLLGLSGLGKSSLLQAGLFPRLRLEGIFPVYIRLDFSAPDSDLVGPVMSTITREARAAQIEAPLVLPGETLWEYFHRQDNDFWNSRNRPVTPLLVFDQFEELFTLGSLDSQRAAATAVLCEQLSDLAEGRPPMGLKARLDERPDEARAFSFTRHPYKILLSIREDFLPDLETLRARMPDVALNRLRLRRMNGEAALLVVNQAPHLIDRDVAEQVVRFVAADQRHLPLSDLEVEPALLSVVCRELNSKRRSLGESMITTGLLEGSHEQVLADFYEQSVADLPVEVRCFIEDHLLTISGYRDSVALDNALSEPGVTRQAIDQLVERRLVRREDRGGVQRLELTHDLLCGVVRESRDRRLQIEATEQKRKEILKEQEEEKRQRDLRDLKRTRMAVVLLLVLFMVSVGAAIMAVKSRQAADKARQEERQARNKAELEEHRAKGAFEMIQKSLLIRQAALSGEEEKLNNLLKSIGKNSRILFDAKETYLRYSDNKQRKIYKFELYPNPATLPTGPDEVAFITYLADDKSFQNSLMTAGPERAYRVNYIGWGCLTSIVALVEYKDPTRPPTVAEFNQCRLLGPEWDSD